MSNKVGTIMVFLAFSFLLHGCGPHALIRSSNSGDLVNVKQQVEKEGVDPNIQDAQGDTPLMHAAWKGNKKVIQYLLGKGVNVNHQDKAGQTALHLAATYRHRDIASLLIDAGADVNVKKNNGSTPLIIAAMNNDEDMVKLLLDHNADVNVENNKNASAYDYAKVRGYGGILEILKKHGAGEGQASKNFRKYIASMSDKDLCLVFMDKKNPDYKDEIDKRNLDCGGVDSSVSYSEGSGKLVKCGQTEISSNVNLDDNEKKAILYLLNKRYIESKKSPEQVCINNVDVEDVIAIKGNKIIKYRAKIYFPQGYLMECERAKRRSEQAKRRGKYSWDGFLSVTTGGCSPFHHMHDPLGYVHHPGDVISVEGEVEI